MSNRSDSTRDVAVVVPAAGSGSRLGGIPKQFRVLGGLPLLTHTLRTVCAVPVVGQVIVCVSRESMPDAERAVALVDFDAVVFTPGGPTRQESVRLGLERLDTSARIVLVHDAARPFVAVEEIAAVIDGVRRFGAAALAVPVTDTLRRIYGEEFGETIPRDAICRMQTPQGFTTEVLLEAHSWARHSGRIGTDDVDLVTARGHTVHVVAGRSSNFKITTADDWRLAESLLSELH